MLFPSIPISSLDEKPSNILWRDIACLAWDLTTPGVRGTAHEESQHLGLVSLSLMSRMVSSETNWVQSYQLPMTFQSQLWLKRKYFQFTAARLLHQLSFLYIPQCTPCSAKSIQSVYYADLAGLISHQTIYRFRPSFLLWTSDSCGLRCRPFSHTMNFERQDLAEAPTGCLRTLFYHGPSSKTQSESSPVGSQATQILCGNMSIWVNPDSVDYAWWGKSGTTSAMISSRNVRTRFAKFIIPNDR